MNAAVEKFFRPIVLVVLIVLLAIQSFALIQSVSSRLSCDRAVRIISESLIKMPDEYQAAAYGAKTDTIYQQMLIASEYQFLTEQTIAQFLIACR